MFKYQIFYTNFEALGSKKFFLFMVSLLSVGNMFAQQIQVIDLQKAVNLTLANNLQIKQASFQAAISDENFKQSRFEQLPSLDGSASVERRYGLFFDQQSGQLLNGTVDQANGRVSSSIPLFQGFTAINQIKQNKNLLLADKSNVEKIKNDLTLNVVNTYLQVLNNKDLMLVTQQQLQLSSNQLALADKRFKVGANTLADVAQAQALQATNQLNVTNAQNAYDQALLNLKQLMEINTETPIEVVAPLVADVSVISEYKSKEVFDKAVNALPEIKLAQYNTEAQKYGLKVAKGRLYPSLSLGGGINTGYTSNSPFSFKEQITNRNFGQSVGFNLAIPLFNNYRLRAGYTIAKIRLENAKNTELLTKNNLNKIINQAVLDLRSAQKRYLAMQSTLASSTEVFNVNKKRYDVGLVNSIELNIAQTAFNKAQFDAIQAKYDLLFRSKVIDFYLGNPFTF
ncbi:MAG: TolC family protein [Sphingobacteriales bacterium]|nr:MAG: TolC family protein [Sphingobacteriales bacterium]TAF79651.1 MAG: TolC family protein [Sphingobacteriales bacterium]